MADPSRVRIGGPLAPFAQGFGEELLRQGYRPNAAANQLQLMAHLSRWLGAKSLDAQALIPPTTTAFLADRRAAGYRLWLSPKALAPLLGYLRELASISTVPSSANGRARALGRGAWACGGLRRSARRPACS